MSGTIKVRVFHGYYGCATGCCGHVVEITTPDGQTDERFSFTHPRNADPKAWARKRAEEVIRARWPGCVDSIDWDSLEFDGVTDQC